MLMSVIADNIVHTF